MKKRKRLKQLQDLYSRRRFMVGLGGLIWLPLLPSLAKAQATPKRKNFVPMWIPHGGMVKNPDLWNPTFANGQMSLNMMFSELQGFEQDLLFIKGLRGLVVGGNLQQVCDRNTNPNLEQEGEWFDVARCLSGFGDASGHICEANSFLTGQFANQAQRLQYPGESIDYTIAKKYGQEPLQLGPHPGVSNPVFDRITWRSQLDPAPKIFSGLALYNTLFAGLEEQSEQFKRMIAQEKSILDGAIDEIKAIKSVLDSEDKIQFERSIESLRRVEIGLKPEAVQSNCATVPERADYEQDVKSNRLNQLVDLGAIAIICGIRNVVSYPLWLASAGGGEEENQGLYVPTLIKPTGYGYHHYSHWWDNPRNPTVHLASDRTDWITFQKYFTGAYSRMVKALKAAVGPDGTTVLDNSLVMIGAQIGETHNYANAHRVIAGKAGGKVRGNRLIDTNQRISDLLPGILEAFDINQPQVGLSKGKFNLG